MNRIKVMIVDDSAFMRKLISDSLIEDDHIEILCVARNGKDAIDKIKRYKPDVVTMDIEMPVMNGLDALNIIMKECPVPVVMLSSTTKEGAENTFHAMQSGAFDFCTKPSGPISSDLYKIKNELKTKIMEAAKANVKLLQNEAASHAGVPKYPFYSKMKTKDESLTSAFKTGSKKKMVVIGTSTGGPRALQTVLMNLPEELDAPVLVVQHMPPGFTKSLAERLDKLCPLKVKEAEDGEEIINGTIYIAPGDYHLQVKRNGNKLLVDLKQTEHRQGHRPSVDVMFESVSQLYEYSITAVIMTGMGSDGSNGLAALKERVNVKCIAESEETSIVFGMPKSAIATNLVDDIENVENIARAICKYC